MKKLLIIILILCLTASVFGQWSGVKPMLGTQIDKAHQLSDPIGAWIFLEGSGGQVFDLSGNGFHGILSGTAVWTKGKFGPSILGNGIDYGIPWYIQGKTQMSCSGWVYLPGNSVTGTVMLLGWEGGGNDVFTLFTNVTENVYFGVDDNATHSTTYAIWTDGFLNNPGWHHIVGTMDGSFVRLYVDSILRATIAWPGGVIDIPSVATLYSYGTTTEIIDTPILWSRALTAGDVALLYREPFCMFEQDLPVELMAQEAPAPTGSQVIIISQIMILACFVYIKQRRKYSIYGECYCS